MQTLLTLALIAIIVFLCRFLITRANLQSIKMLNKQFNEWYERALVPDVSESELAKLRPNNELFSKLYKIVYKDNKAIVNISDTGTYAGQPTIFQNKADVVQSFPTIHHSVIRDELTLLDNIQDYFQVRYDENFKFAYWINVLIFLPQQFVKYIGLKEESVLSKVLNVIWWLALLLLAAYKPLISKIIHSSLH